MSVFVEITKADLSGTCVSPDNNYVYTSWGNIICYSLDHVFYFSVIIGKLVLGATFP